LTLNIIINQLTKRSDLPTAAIGSQDVIPTAGSYWQWFLLLPNLVW